MAGLVLLYRHSKTLYSKFHDPCITNFWIWTPLKWKLLSGKAVKAVIKSTIVRYLKLKSHWSGHRLGLESVCVASWMNWTVPGGRIHQSCSHRGDGTVISRSSAVDLSDVEVSCVPASSSSSKSSRHQPYCHQNKEKLAREEKLLACLHTVAACLAA